MDTSGLLYRAVQRNIAKEGRKGELVNPSLETIAMLSALISHEDMLDISVNIENVRAVLVEMSERIRDVAWQIEQERT